MMMYLQLAEIQGRLAESEVQGSNLSEELAALQRERGRLLVHSWPTWGHSQSPLSPPSSQSLWWRGSQLSRHSCSSPTTLPWKHSNKSGIN